MRRSSRKSIIRWRGNKNHNSAKVCRFGGALIFSQLDRPAADGHGHA